MTGNDTRAKAPLTKLELFLRFNEAKILGGRIYYRHTLAQLALLKRKILRARRVKHDTLIGEKEIDIVDQMVKSRTSHHLVRCELPKKLQRKMGLLPKV